MIILHSFYIKTTRTNQNKGSCLTIFHRSRKNNTKSKTQNLKTYEQKASDSGFENPISEDIEKDMALNKLNPLDKSRSSSKTGT